MLVRYLVLRDIRHVCVYVYTPPLATTTIITILSAFLVKRPPAKHYFIARQWFFSHEIKHLFPINWRVHEHNTHCEHQDVLNNFSNSNKRANCSIDAQFVAPFSVITSHFHNATIACNRHANTKYLKY